MLAILVIIIFAILLVALKVFFDIHTGKWEEGEEGVRHRLSYYYGKKGAKVLTNLYIPYGDDKTTEIDVIMLYKSGIYVIESKNYKCQIKGHSRTRSWTKIYPSKDGTINEMEFYNPILQNENHIKSLDKFLDIPDLKFYNIIVFSNKTEFQDLTITPEANASVIKMRDITDTINYFSQKHISAGFNLSDEEIESIYNKLLPCTKPPQEVIDKHDKDVQEKENKFTY